MFGFEFDTSFVVLFWLLCGGEFGVQLLPEKNTEA